jgi:glycosyltransferase involved in cell wall biosynthesis
MDIVRARWIPGLRDIELLEYPIDTEHLYRAADSSWSGGPKVFLFTGRLEHRKGVQILLPAFDQVARELPDVELHLAGHDTPTFVLDGRSVHFAEYMKSLDLHPDTLGRVRFLGRKTLEELIPLYQSAYACVIPSVSFENFPNSCLEAVACGKAVIVTDLGGMVEMAPEGVAGIHVKANDVASLAAAIRRLALDPDETRRLGEGARRNTVENYSTGRMVQKIVDAYERTIAAARYR